MVREQARVGLEVDRRGVRHVVPLGLHVADHREVPVEQLSGAVVHAAVGVGPVERHREGARARAVARDVVETAVEAVALVCGVPAPVVVGLPRGDVERVEDRRRAGVIAHGEGHVVLELLSVRPLQLHDVGAGRPRGGNRERVAGRPVALGQAEVRIVLSRVLRTRRLVRAAQRAHVEHQAAAARRRARRAVRVRPRRIPTEPVDVHRVLRVARQGHLEVDRAALVDARLGRVALDLLVERLVVDRQLPARRPRILVLEHDRVRGRDRRRHGSRRRGRRACADAVGRGHGERVRRAVRQPVTVNPVAGEPVLTGVCAFAPMNGVIR